MMNDMATPSPSDDDAIVVPPGDVVANADETQPKRGLSTKKINAYINERLGEHASAAAVLVRDVVKRTRLWRKEKFDVACELIDHFQQAIEHGATVDDAVRDFGNAAEAAKMIRRSKLRCRSLFWKGRMWCNGAVGVMIVFYLAMGVYLWLDAPAPKIDYLATLNGPIEAIPESERAWPIYDRTLDELWQARLELDKPFSLSTSWHSFPRYQSPVKREGDALLNPTEQAVVADRSVVRQFMIEHSGLIEQLRVAAAKPHMGAVFEPNYAWAKSHAKDLGDATLPLFVAELPNNRLAMVYRWLEWDAYLAAQRGDHEAAYRDFIALFQLAHQRAEQGGNWRQQGLSRVRVLFDFVNLIDILHHYPALFTDAELVSLAQNLTQASDVAKVSMAFEAMEIQDVMQRIYGEGGQISHRGVQALPEITLRHNGSFRSYAPNQLGGGAGQDFFWWPFIRFNSPSRDEVDAELTQYVQTYRAYLELPRWERKLVDPPTLGIGREFLFNPLGLFRSHLAGVANNSDVAEIYRSTALVLIGLQRYRRAHNDWPETLEQLTPSFLASVPPDLLTGEPMLYARTADGPRLYMVGRDEDDDGGRLPRNIFGEPEYWEPRLNQSEGPGGGVPDGDWVLYPWAG